MFFFVDKEKITTEDRPSNTFKLRKGGKLFSLQCYSDKSDFCLLNLKFSGLSIKMFYTMD